MESPDYWNRLTASLAVVGLADEQTAWAFVRDEGLVRDEPGNRERFYEAVREIRDTEITGPSPAARVAARLQSLGMVVHAIAEEKDPSGQKAQARLKHWRKSTGPRPT